MGDGGRPRPGRKAADGQAATAPQLKCGEPATRAAGTTRATQDGNTASGGVRVQAYARRQDGEWTVESRWRRCPCPVQGLVRFRMLCACAQHKVQLKAWAWLPGAQLRHAQRLMKKLSLHKTK